MRTLQAYLPDPRRRDIHRIFVAAPPEVAWRAMRDFDVERIPWVHFLSNLRTLPDRLLMTWAWVLEPVGAEATRLATRVRAQAAPGWMSWLIGAMVYPPVHGLMQRA